MLKYDNTVSSQVDGKPIYGAQVSVYTADTNTPTLATIFADEAGTTPLSQPILTDQLGYFAFYIGDGKYNIRVMTGAVEISRTNITMVDTLQLKQRALIVPVNEDGGTLPPANQRQGKLLGFDTGGNPTMAVPNSFAGPTGPANSTYTTLAGLKAAAVSNASYIFAPPTGSDGGAAAGTFLYQTAGAPYTADGVNVIKLDAVPLATGALVRQNASGIAFQQPADGAVSQDAATKLAQSVSTADFTDPQKAVKRFGTDVTEGVTAKVNVARGTTTAASIGAQGTALIGDARLGSIIKASSAGSASLVDARINRDGTTANTQGHAHIENLSLDLDGKARVGATVYGGSNIVRNAQIYNLTGGSTGLGIQYVLMTQIDQVTVTGGGIGFEVNVDAVHAGDVNTSLVMTAAWSIHSGIGFKVDHLQYSTLISCCAQEATGWGYIFDGATGDAVTSMNGITLLSCGAEVNAGGAFYFKAQRSTSLVNPFIIPSPGADSVRWESSIGQIVGLRDTATHTGGTVGLRIVNPLGLGLVLVDGGEFPMDSSHLKYCTFRGAIINGAIRDSVTDLWFNAGADSQMVRERVVGVPDDFAMLGRYSASGMLLGGERISGGNFISNGGPLVNPGAALSANTGFIHWDETTLTITVKTPSGALKPIQLSFA